MTRLCAARSRSQGQVRLVVAIAVFTALVGAPATAHGLEVVVAMPDNVAVGQTGLTAHVTLTNNSPELPATICNAGECTGPSEGIVFIPSCASASAAPTCSAPDAGVFSFAPTAAIAVGSQCGANALVTGFDVVVLDAVQGKIGDV